MVITGPLGNYPSYYNYMAYITYGQASQNMDDMDDFPALDSENHPYLNRLVHHLRGEVG